MQRHSENAPITDIEIQNIIGSLPDSLPDSPIGAQPDLYRQAFVHKSRSKMSYERLEFLGDSVLNLATANFLFRKYPNKNEGLLTKLNEKIVRGPNCTYLGRCIGLDKWIISSAECSDRMIADVFEAFLGSMYLNIGFENTSKFIQTVITKYMNLNSPDDNYIHIIMRHTQINKLKKPKYIVKVSGPVNKRLFTVKLVLTKDSLETEYGTGTGHYNKEAEQNACKASLCFTKDCKIEHINNVIHF